MNVTIVSTSDVSLIAAVPLLQYNEMVANSIVSDLGDVAGKVYSLDIFLQD